MTALAYRPAPDARTVYCDECPKTWRYGCSECAELFADYHRQEFGHHCAVAPALPDDYHPTRPRRHRRNWWET